MTRIAPAHADVAALFTPARLGQLSLRSRIVMAPMTREYSPAGVPGPDVAAYYARRARADVGLIVTEGAVVDHPASASSNAVPRMYGADALAGWRTVVDAVHAEGGVIFPQLWHVGADYLFHTDKVRPGDRGAVPADMREVSPSGYVPPDIRIGEPMTDAEIADIIDAFARAAASAKEVGFDGIELHGAHGYLLDAFLWSVTNRRQDRWGGSVAARATFAAEVVRACRAAVGPDFPIQLRLSQWKVNAYDARIADDEVEFEALLTPLVDAGVDSFHCSTRRIWEPAFAGSTLNLAGWARKITGRTVISVGSVGLEPSDFLTYLDGRGVGSGRLDDVVRRIEEGEFDLVAVGRALVTDPEWAAKVRTGRWQELKGFDAASLNTLT